jgi:hypothetical protein
MRPSELHLSAHSSRIVAPQQTYPDVNISLPKDYAADTFGDSLFTVNEGAPSPRRRPCGPAAHADCRA